MGHYFAIYSPLPPPFHDSRLFVPQNSTRNSFVSHLCPIVSWSIICREACIFGQKALLGKKVKSAHAGAKRLIRPKLIRVSVAWSDREFFYSPLDGMLVHSRSYPPVLIFAGTHLIHLGVYINLMNIFSRRPLQIPSILVRQPSEDLDHGGESLPKTSGDEELEYVIWYQHSNSPYWFLQFLWC